MATRLLWIVASCMMLLGSIGRSAAADDVEQFYKSHNLRIVIGHEVGTGFDLYGRLLARHLGRFLPGHPTIIPENMVGVAGLAAANWLFNAAPKDGSVIAIFAHTAPFDPLLGDSAGKFDGTQFTWIGNMDPVVGLCGVWQTAGIASFDELFTKETLVGSSGTGTAGPLTQFPTALRKLLGVKIKLIQGYQGSADVRLAMERGEVQGVCGIPLSTVETEWRDDYAAGRFKLILQLGHDKEAKLAGLRHVYEYAKTDEDRQVFDLIFGLQAIGRPFAAPPKIPVDRAAALRAAFMATVADPDFLVDAGRLMLDVVPTPGDQVQEFVQKIYATPRPVVQRAQGAVRP